jgi:hypothetical protein
MHAALPGSLARQPCPAALPGSLAQQPCPAALQAFLRPSAGMQHCILFSAGSLVQAFTPISFVQIDT